MNTQILTRALALLIALSFVTTTLAKILPDAGPVFALTVLALSGMKSRVILKDYLGLRNAPLIQRGFTQFLTAFLGLAALLYALPLIA